MNAAKKSGSLLNLHLMAMLIGVFSLLFLSIVMPHNFKYTAIIQICVLLILSSYLFLFAIFFLFKAFNKNISKTDLLNVLFTISLIAGVKYLLVLLSLFITIPDYIATKSEKSKGIRVISGGSNSIIGYTFIIDDPGNNIIKDPTSRPLDWAASSNSEGVSVLDICRSQSISLLWRNYYLAIANCDY